MYCIENERQRVDARLATLKATGPLQAPSAVPLCRGSAHAGQPTAKLVQPQHAA
eukprot:CAMPEP_0174282726 /NCGR_PEP_ID=MMETSP0809-20121228/3277_1 /TAXON_ID=73025 ORGANISM="Eutreptiella gymnastica-like, Strain CCMP1594" /NCGR_SAMPLE_ID=MMETSP0809 /ASSEMBLY_ACC=CAM_ASM_000658 /LENGTH=53 /DNA_ID=CAMNT_0015377129 /DNA_START=603 /DNA_END=761 /DNA_ORIENTATION=+